MTLSELDGKIFMPTVDSRERKIPAKGQIPERGTGNEARHDVDTHAIDDFLCR